jgi:hypothetical protein
MLELPFVNARGGPEPGDRAPPTWIARFPGVLVYCRKSVADVAAETLGYELSGAD